MVRLPISIIIESQSFLVILGQPSGTYLLNAFALTQLKASTIGAFVYLQTLNWGAFCLFTGQETNYRH